MSLNKSEQQFVNSIKNKIKKYSIPITLKEAFNASINTMVYTIYKDDTIELVDAGIEMFLIRNSFAYFLNNYCRVDIPGAGTVPMNPYYFQSEFAKEINKYRKIVVDKSRQTGLSTISSFYAFWRAHFFPAEVIDVISLKQQKAQNFVKKFRSTMAALPRWMKTPIKNDNTTKIVWEFTDGSQSEIVSEPQSDNAGRSDSLSLLVLDEVAHYRSENMVNAIISSAQPTLNKTGGQMFIVSTPNGTVGRGAYYYKQVVQAKHGKDPNTKYLEVDWWEIPDDSILLPNAPKKGYNEILQQAIEEDYYHNLEIKKKYKEFFEPIAKTQWHENDWLKASRDDLGDMRYRQEVLHEFIISGNRVFTEEQIDELAKRVKPPKIKDTLGNKAVDGLWIWKEPIPSHRYLISCDIATGTGSDYSSIEVFDVDEYEQTAEYKNFVSTPNLSKLIKKIARWYNEGLVVIECNGVGEAVFNGVYYDDADSYTNIYKQKKSKNGVTRFTGWITDTKTRKLLANEFIDWMTVDTLLNTLKFYSERLLMEMSTWIWDGSGKAIHSDSSHDDSIIAFALALYLRNKATNSGQSFLITEDGSTVSFDRKDNNDTNEDLENSFSFVTAENETKKNVDQLTDEHYQWLIS